MEDEKLVEICNKIYAKHRKALDLIFEHRIDGRTRLVDIVKDTLLSLSEENVITTEAIANTNSLAFHTSAMNEQLPPLEQAISAFGTEYTNVLQEAFKCIQDDAPAAQQNGPQTLDFSQDWGLINAAFLQAYGIDLDKHLHKIHWLRFLSLLRSVPDGTKLAWVQEIRATPMPKPTRHNGEERARLSKLKTFYAIRHKQKSPDEQMQSLYDTLATMAKGR